MVVPKPDTGILDRLYANLVGGNGVVSLDVREKVLKRLHTYGSLTDTDGGGRFEVERQVVGRRIRRIRPSRDYRWRGAPRRRDARNVGVAQMPMGLAGPPKLEGEHADGQYPIPLATTGGTLVASYGRGMKTLNLSGDVTATVVDHRMSRAPVFVFEDARTARDFRDWVFDYYGVIKTEGRGDLECRRTGRNRRLPHQRPRLSPPRVRNRGRRRPEHGREGHLRGL
ncbi:hypothetical protein [Halorientalis sp.]|jgi:hypothetical protein|uniref:hypothetical protein n=1 Tax=Halorientalis sp. TaxID=1931229 RepID=UPI002638A11E|nr:hypothetical protein [Halorientalis sp.]